MRIDYIYRKINFIVLAVMCIVAMGCKKFIEVPPPIDSLPTGPAFSSDTRAASTVRALYGQMSGTTGFFTTTLAFSGGVQLAMNVSSDELVPSDVTNEFYLHQITPTNGSNDSNIWAALYNIIYGANAVIENVPQSPGVSEAGKKQFVAEAKFIRAANYFYLVNLYGGVPLITSTDYRVNSVLPRNSADEVYTLILSDLEYSVANLGPAYIGTSTSVPLPQRLRANKYAAAALLARVYLYRKNYAKAEEMATLVIEGAGKTMYDFEPDLSRTFLTSSKEVILQIQQPGTNLYTYDAYNQIPSSSTAIPAYQLSDALTQAFEAGDQRKVNWTATTLNGGKTYYYPFKYKIKSGTGTVRTESMVFLRLSEVYLVRAEARVQQNKLTLAIDDIDAVRRRSILPSSFNSTNPAAGKGELIDLVLHERFVELFAEVGHRWMDLIRTGKADEVLKNSQNWRPEAKLFPIPKGDVDKNPAIKQNPGYN